MSAASPSFERLRAARMSAVGAAFLRARPRIVAPMALGQMGLIAASGAPIGQRAALGAVIASAILFFVVEARIARHRPVTRRWLGLSLGLTALGLGLGALLSGGLASPLVPLVLAPVVVAFAAFGRRRETLALLCATFAFALALALTPRAWPFPLLPEPELGWMRLLAFAGATALAWVGVAALADAHATLGQTLDAMRLATLEEAASRMRATEQVGARVAHELKNPLAAQKALLQLVLRGEGLDERTRQRLDVAYAETERMEVLARDYLAFVKPLSDLRPEPVDLRRLLDEVRDVLEARAADAAVELCVTGPAVAIDADPRRLREALLNLADNALAASPRGGAVTLALTPDELGAVIRVRDTGRGLPPEVLAGPGTTPFLTTRPDGTGLGLVLARAAVTQHGGGIAFASRAGQGTTVTIALPRVPGGPVPFAAPGGEPPP